MVNDWKGEPPHGGKGLDLFLFNLRRSPLPAFPVHPLAFPTSHSQPLIAPPQKSIQVICVFATQNGSYLCGEDKYFIAGMMGMGVQGRLEASSSPDEDPMEDAHFESSCREWFEERRKRKERMLSLARDQEKREKEKEEQDKKRKEKEKRIKQRREKKQKEKQEKEKEKENEREKDREKTIVKKKVQAATIHRIGSADSKLEKRKSVGSPVQEVKREEGRKQRRARTLRMKGQAVLAG